MQDDVAMDQMGRMERDHRFQRAVADAEARGYAQGLEMGSRTQEESRQQRWVRGGADVMPLPAGTVLVHPSGNPQYPLEAKVYWRMGWDYWAQAGASGNRRDEELVFPCLIVHAPAPGREDMLKYVHEHIQSLPTKMPTPEEIRAYETGEGQQ